jgi:hypothetical protein
MDEIPSQLKQEEMLPTVQGPQREQPGIEKDNFLVCLTRLV